MENRKNTSGSRNHHYCRGAKSLVVEKEEAMFGIVEAMPEFPGGQKALMAYIAKNTNYPQDAPCISGRVIVQFTITKKGRL
ncbi:hypothetical protein SFC43_02040 [Bacteroides sp. CR5/BHMF/2]|nr:hypothetical protein [Bacteroides sp. CR5/BHMF/2]